MASRTGTAHVVTTKREYNGKVYQTHLLRRSYREDGKVKNETLGNLSHLPDSVIDLIRRSLQGETFVPAGEAFEVCSSRPHGHVQAVSLAMQRLGFASLLGTKPCAERDLVQAMVASRILCPATKLATTRLWHASTLAEDFGVQDASEDDLYAAMDWLLAGQDRIQKKLAARHLQEDSLVLYDLSSSYFEGSHCPLAKLGYSRDGKRGTLQVNYGLLTDDRGCPVAISVHEGNTSDSTTFLPQVKRMREQFGVRRMVMVGDRGMISQKAIDEMSEDADLAWITALRSSSIRTLVEQKHLQLGLFDERNLLEISSPDFPGERLQISVAPIPTALIDTQLLRIALSNLIENAFKYSPPRSAVQVSASPHSHRRRSGILFSISNEAGSAGLPDPNRVFRKYYRAPGAHSKTSSGLGLYLVRGAARQMGGWVRYASRDGGVCFEFWIPV